MPRQAHGRPITFQPRKSHHERRKRGNALNALEVAEKQIPQSIRVRRNRLGEVEDDSDDQDTGADANQPQTKRRKLTDVVANLDERRVREDEDLDSGSDIEGGRWHEGVNDSDEDSDIDSDEAFGMSDEEKFADFTFRGSTSSTTRTKRKPGTTKPSKVYMADHDENSEWQDANAFNEERADGSDEDPSEYEEEDDGLGEDAIDLATALDMNLAEEQEEAQRAMKKTHKRINPRDTLLSEDEETDSDIADDESQFSLSDDEAAGDLPGLKSFVSNLEASSSGGVVDKKSAIKALADKPSTFGLGSAKLSASDLARYITDPVQRQSLKLLQAGENNPGKEHRGGILGKLSAPLAKRQQDRLDRAAAYEKSKETLNRWIDTVKNNRRSEHISFSLADPGSSGVMNTNHLPKTSVSKPQTDLEDTIRKILVESGVGQAPGEDLEDQEAAFEELKEKKIPLEDVRERRAQLRLARELMFREEIRAKRIKKIKSKAYRRVHRKERDRNEAQQREQLSAAGLLNSDEEREKNDRQRAEERMGARHKESKWAKGVKQIGRAAWDDDARIGVSELARRDEELRRRIEGKMSTGSDVSESGTESESGADDSDVEDGKIQQKLAKVEAVDARNSRLSSMAFMQRAEAARKAENDEEVRQIRLSMTGEHDTIEENDGADFEPASRQRFGGNTASAKPFTKKQPQRAEFEAFLSEDELVNQEGTEIPDSAKFQTKQRGQSASRTSRTEVGAVTSSKATTVNGHGTEPRRKKQAKPSGIEKPDDVQMDEYTSPSDTDEEVQASLTTFGDNDKAALAASIFAGPDDVVREFAKEKAELVEEEGDQVIDNTLPGWGNWTGVGISKREQKKGKGRFLVTMPGVAPDKRQDAKLDRVIINEKRVKKNGKYLATELPHPFESRQQYERSLRLPMGPEWSTVNHYQDAIKPRVLQKQGTVIRPIAKPVA